MKPRWHYYEAHITIEPEFGERLYYLKKLMEDYSFKVADLLMKKRKDDTEQRSKHDTFCTGRSDNLQDLIDRTKKAVMSLQEQDYEVWRYKIESTVIDSRYEDKFNILDKQD